MSPFRQEILEQRGQGRSGEPKELERPVILCVDDEPAMLASIRRTLASEHVRVVITDDPVEALSWLDRSPVSLIMVDERMPEMAGITLLRIVEKRSPDTCRVLITGLPEGEEVAERAGDTVQHWIAKPWSNEELQQMVRDLVPQSVRRPAQPVPEPAAGPSSEPFVEPLPEALAESLAQFGSQDLPEPPSNTVPVPKPLHQYRRLFLKDTFGWVDAAGLSGFSVLCRIARRLAQAAAAESNLVILLRNLTKLRDDPQILFQGLQVGVSKYGLKTLLVDPSGLATQLIGTAVEVDPLLRSLSPETGAATPRRTLLACADPVELGLLRYVLLASGHTCYLASTLGRALKRVKKEGIELAVIDGDLPDASAMELVEQLSARKPRVETVLLSRRPLNWSYEVFSRLGILGCVAKPYGLQEVLDLVNGD